jgi:hypothetical protein
MSYRTRPARTDDDEVVFTLRGLLNDLQNRLTELDDNVRRYAALLERLRLRMKRFTQGLLVFRSFGDSQKRGLGSEGPGQQSAEIDCGLR